MLALYSGMPTWACAALMTIAVQDVNRIFSSFVMLLHHSFLREQPPVPSHRSRSRMPKHWVKTLKTNKIKIVLDAT